MQAVTKPAVLPGGRHGWQVRVAPGYFAFVMATGIVSLAAHLQEVPLVPAASVRAQPGRLPGAAGDHASAAAAAPFRPAPRHWPDHAVGPTFLTMVAATGVLGAQFASLTSFLEIALVLWLWATLLWVILLYGFFLGATLASPKPPIERGLSGAWLLVTVSTKSLCVLGTSVADLLPRPEIGIFACVCFFLLGGMFYAVLIALILYRWLFLEMTPGDAGAALLDQHGRGGDRYARGRRTYCSTRRAIPASSASSPSSPR